MKLDERIGTRKIVYLLTRDAAIAFELALYYFISAKRKNTDKKIADTCHRSLYWLKIAAVDVPEDVRQLRPAEQLVEIERILVKNKDILAVSALGGLWQTIVDARRCRPALAGAGLG